MGLLEALTQYIKDSLPGGSLNPEQPAKLSGLLDAGKKQAQYIGGLLDPNSPISKDAQNWHKRTQIGLADQLAGRQTPEAEQAYQTMMQAAGIAPVGMIAWHGSPHKFDKFDLSKIGTGEGAQAYGHGLYLAENPSVAREYQERLGGFQPSEITSQFKDLIAGLPASAQKFLTESQAARTPIDQMKQKALQSKVQAASWDAQDVKKGLPPSRSEYVSAMDEAIAFLEKNALPKPPNPGHMYKTDIPDEAVARFLDWDKPLSQQAPEVQRAFAKMRDKFPLGADGWDIRPFMDADPLASTLHNSAVRDLGVNPDFFTKNLSEAGVPGIRYLDGGSRSAGQGSSNFVAFDPEMIRILERNGQPTGLQPWKPGEWK